VLVLEENAAVQELVDQALREADHRVLSTKHALEAVELARRVRIDVLVGVLLEERTHALINELRSIQPGLHVVGICDPDDELDGVERSVRLSSPFALDDLREAVAAGLESRA